MIKVSCVTHLDLKNEKWPTELPAVPRVGDRIESSTKHYNGLNCFQLQLQVVRVYWKHYGWKDEYYPEIELHMTDWQSNLTSVRGGAKGSITAFYEWYAPLVGSTVGSFI